MVVEWRGQCYKWPKDNELTSYFKFGIRTKYSGEIIKRERIETTEDRMEKK